MKPHHTSYGIGDVARLTGLSADTLRYYERCGLLPAVNRTRSGIRRYTERDLSRLRFIQRAQGMNFKLAEIGDLLQMREDPTRARAEVRQIASAKLDDIEHRIADLTTLRNELRLLLNLCAASDEGCPILERLGTEPREA